MKGGYLTLHSTQTKAKDFTGRWVRVQERTLLDSPISNECSSSSPTVPHASSRPSIPACRQRTPSEDPQSPHPDLGQAGILREEPYFHTHIQTLTLAHDSTAHFMKIRDLDGPQKTRVYKQANLVSKATTRGSLSRPVSLICLS